MEHKIINSYNQFKTERKGTIKTYLLHLLKGSPGLDTRQISDISGISINKLTDPIQKLLNEGLIEVSGIHKSMVSNRMVQVYSLIN